MAKKLTDKVQTNTLQMLLAVAGFIVFIYYGTNALSAKDAFWFMPGFHDQPSRIVLYQAGKVTEWLPGQPGFDELANGVVGSLNQGTTRGSAMGFSDESLQDAYHLYTTLEVFFDHPVKLHAAVSTGEPTQMLFPIEGRSSDINLVLMGVNGKYLSNSPLLKTTAPIRQALRDMGYIQ